MMAECERFDKLEAERERRVRNTQALQKRMAEIANENNDVKQNLQKEIDTNKKELAETEDKIKKSKETMDKMV